MTTTCLERSILEPIRTSLSVRELWHGADRGLIYCWERGREMRAGREVYPDTAREAACEWASRGELRELPWKGHGELLPPKKKTKKKATSEDGPSTVAPGAGDSTPQAPRSRDSRTVVDFRRPLQAVIRRD